MGWSEIDDQDDYEKEVKKKHNPPKRFNTPEDDGAYKQKRSGKRFHRVKTHKDLFWENDDAGHASKK